MADFVGLLNQSAQALGMNPVDLATIISYETAGTFDPTKRGPTTQWGQHRGLIQFGEPQAKQYGVDWSNPLQSQLGPEGAVVRYFRQNGWQPGMGILDAYSIVNAGGPGLYNRSDANNGGAPGTVRDKVEKQFGPHRAKAAALFGGQSVANDTMRALGREPMAPQTTQGGGGLLSMIGGQGQDQMQQPQSFMDRTLKNQDWRQRAAIALEGMTLNPNVGLINMLGGDVKDRATEKKATAAKNKTVEWLRSIGQEQWASAVETGAVDAGSAVNAAMAAMQPKQQEQTALMQNVQWLQSQGIPLDKAIEMSRGGTTVNVGDSGPKLVGTSGLATVPDANEPYGIKTIVLPGSPLALEQEKAEREAQKATQAAATKTEKTGLYQSETVRAAEAAKKMMEKKGPLDILPEAGIVGALLANLGINQEAVNLDQTLKTVKSGVAFDRLQAMRDMSVTGGALGSVTENELALLMSSLGSLDQRLEPKILKENLDNIIRIMGKIEADPVASQVYAGAIPVAPSAATPDGLSPDDLKYLGVGQ